MLPLILHVIRINTYNDGNHYTYDILNNKIHLVLNMIFLYVPISMFMEILSNKQGFMFVKLDHYITHCKLPSPSPCNRFK